MEIFVSWQVWDGTHKSLCVDVQAQDKHGKIYENDGKSALNCHVRSKETVFLDYLITYHTLVWKTCQF